MTQILSAITFFLNIDDWMVLTLTAKLDLQVQIPVGANIFMKIMNGDIRGMYVVFI